MDDYDDENLIISKETEEDDYQEILYNMRIVGNFGAMENSLYTDVIQRIISWKLIERQIIIFMIRYFKI